MSKRHNFVLNKSILIDICCYSYTKRKFLRAEWSWYVMFYIKR
ncbi:hypothetical protein HMPREF9442_00156 [Paraprevotella xylaniphila YIT 11841]|uniref:Uncharacterized protein n=1 Tax=Paraprevotella xylaniphila YIT 11841 TaxID=762982 RepID=F3QPR9_9BACT|nr:hypothetical protein HMPREF9442_00156 [Paraprevotella xylaniphila YIT 11841]